MRFRGSWAVLWLSVLACASGVAVAAAAPGVPLQVPDSAAPTFTVYTARDGLGDEVWSTTGLAPDGVTWAGSASSLARFDGYRWQRHALPQARSLVRDMASDADGTLWAIFESEGLFRFDGQDWQAVGEARSHTRFSVLEDAAGRRELWVGHGRGLARLQDGTWVEDAGNATVPPGPVAAIARTRTLGGAPREWLGSQGGGLWFRDVTPTPGPWQRYADPALDTMAMTDLHRSVDEGVEELWVLSYGAGVARLRADGLRVWRADAGELPTEAIYTIAESFSSAGGRSLWLSSRAGLLRFRGEQFDVFDRRHGLPADAVRGVEVRHGDDGIDTLWVATEGGLARAVLADNPWRTVSLLGAADNGVFGVLVEANGRGGERLWLGSARAGVAMLEDGRWRFLSEAAGDLPARTVRGLWRVRGDDGREHRLLAMAGAPLLEIGDDLVVRALPTPWPVTAENYLTHVLARDVDGHVEWWVATSHAGLWRRRDSRWQRIEIDSGAQSRAAWLAEQVDRSGHSWLWVADWRGLARFDGSRWQRVASPQPSHDGFRAVTVLADGDRQVLWVAGNQGVQRLDVTAPMAPRPLPDGDLPPPPDRVVYSVLGDSAGRVYVCTNNGVQLLTRRAGGGWDERVFRRADGLVHDECNTGSQFVDAHDRYWVGTLAGLAMFDPAVQSEPTATARSPLRFTALRIDGEAHPLPRDGAIAIAVAADTRELHVEYSLLTGQREGESRYRTQLVGLESAPGAWTGEHSRTFSGLAPGDYVLRVQARDFAGTVAEPRELRVSIALRWWQIAWLQLLAAGVALLLSAFAVLAWNRGLRARQKQLRRQVAKRTQELHDANLRLTELSYRDPLTGIANRRRLVEVLASAIERGADQCKPVGLLVADVDHFKAYNDRHGHLAGDAALRAIAAAMGSVLRSQDLVARFGGEEFACVMEDADLDVVSRVGERMRALIEALPPRALGNDGDSLTVSIGLLSRVPDAAATPEALLHAADVALYAAKAAGRNQVQIADG